MCSCLSSMAASSTIWDSSDSRITLSLQLCSTCLSFLSQWFPLRQSPQRPLSTCLEALYFSTYHASFVHLPPHQVAANGILSCHTTIGFAIFHASRSWHALKPHSSFSLSTVSPAWRSTSTSTRWTRGAWSLSRKRHRLPMAPIIHHCSHRRHHQNK